MKFKNTLAGLLAAAVCAAQTPAVSLLANETSEIDVSAVVAVRDGVTYILDGENAQIAGFTDDLPESVFIPEVVVTEDGEYTVTAVLSGAFEDTKAVEIILPAAVGIIEEGAFADCEDLLRIQFYNEEIEIEEDAIRNCPNAEILLEKEDDEIIVVLDPDQEEENTLAEYMPVEPDEEESGVYASVTVGGSWERCGDSDWKYRLNDGTYVNNGWNTIDGDTYYFKDGLMYRGWLDLNGTWYFLNNNGTLAVSRWISGIYYVDENGVWIHDPGLKTENNHLVYIQADGNKLRDAWKRVDNEWYWFGSDGYAFNDGWHTIEGKDYYFYSDGKMAYNTTIDGWTVNWSGEKVVVGWRQVDNNWMYCYSKDNYAKNGWITVDGKDYYMNADGIMQTGLLNLNGTYYYCTSNGAKVTDGFVRVNGNVYYFQADGTMLYHPFRANGVRFIPESGTGKIYHIVIKDKDYYAGSTFTWNSVFTSKGVYSLEEASSILGGLLNSAYTTSGNTLTRTISNTTYQLLRFPMKYMKISQGASASFSHAGNDALDICGRDTGSDPYYAPCDMHLVYQDTYAHGNALFFESDSPVLFADGTIDYATFMFIHDTYVGDLKTSYKQWEEVGDEGIAGNATGNHVHVEVAKGKYTKPYYKNVDGVNVLPNSVSPDAAFVVDGITLYNNGQTMSSGRTMYWRYASDIVYPAPGLSSIPSNAVKQDGKFWITVSALNVRTGPSTSDSKVTTYTKGTGVVYDCYVRQNGETWLGFLSVDGQRRWICAGEHDGEKYTDAYGVFEY